MTQIQQQKAAKEFAERWKGKGYEKGESQIFWSTLLTEVFGVEHVDSFLLYEQQVHLDHTSFIDGFIPSTKVMIEQKSLNKDLGAPIKQSDGTSLNPFQQAKRYAAELPYSQRPRWIVTCNFREFWVYDMEQPNGEPQKIMQLIAWDISERGQCALGSSQQFTPRTILITEPTARILATEYETLEELEDSLIIWSRRPVKERAFANLYANTGGQKNYTMNQYTRYIEQSEGGQTTTTPPWYDRTESTQKTVPCMRKDSTVFIITGDTARNKVQVMPGGGHSTCQVEVPANWNELMQAKGYEPLESFFIGGQEHNPATSSSSITTENASNVPVHQRGSTIINEQHGQMAVFDATGKMIARTRNDYNMQALPDGVYFVRIAGIEGACRVIKK